MSSSDQSVSVVLCWILIPGVLSALAKCPIGCTCSEKSVICSCEESLGGESGTSFTLPPLSGINYVHTLIIHTCNTVVLPNDTFNGIVFHQLIKLIAIKEVIIEPWAFRGVLRSPAQLVIQETSLPEIPSNAFSGLSNLKHIWFRNATIGAIAPRAFEHVANVEYIYFRDSTIVRLDDYAFGSMHDVDNLFLRGNVHIRTMGSMVFLKSQIGQLTLEEVRMNGNEYSFMGLQARHLLVLRCRWRQRRTRLKHRPPAQAIGHLHIHNSSIDRLALATFYNSTRIQIERTLIGELAYVPSVRLRNVRRIEVIESTINQWSPSALHSANRVKLLEVVNSHIGTVMERAMRNAHIDRPHQREKHLYLTDVSVYRHKIDIMLVFKKTSLERISPLAFEKSRLGTLSWSECQVGTIAENAFSKMVSKAVSISDCKLAVMAANCFAELTATSFAIVSSKIAQTGHTPFANAEISSLAVDENQFDSPHLSTMFSRLRASSLTVTNNMFGCEPHDCETNALVLASGQRRMPWHFDHNSCRDASATQRASRDVCAREREWQEGNVRCRAKHEIVECVCVDDTQMAIVPQSNASVMLVGDCPRLLVKMPPASPTVSLHIYRAEALEFELLPPLLNTLQVFHSKIDSIAETAFAHLRLERFEIIATHIAAVKRNAFRGATVHNLILRDSSLSSLERGAFGSSRVESLFAESCKLYDVEELWRHVSNASVSDSFVSDVRALLHAQKLCFHESATACACVPEEFTERNACESNVITCQQHVDGWSEDLCVETTAQQTSAGSGSLASAIPSKPRMMLLFLLYRYFVSCSNQAA